MCQEMHQLLHPVRSRFGGLEQQLIPRRPSPRFGAVIDM